MPSKKNKKPKLESIDVKGRIPESLQYESLKSMSREPSERDIKKRERKQIKQDIKRSDSGWDL